MVLGFVKDKDLELIFSQLPQDAHIIFVPPNMSRAEEVSVLMKLAENYTPECRSLITSVSMSL